MNYLTVRNAKNNRRTMKVYTRARMGLVDKFATFAIRGFLRKDAPKHYMLLSFEGPIAWVISRDELIKTWNELNAGKLPNDTLSAPAHLRATCAETGIIHCHMTVDNRFVLRSPKQLGL